jgi:hypothetical protein
MTEFVKIIVTALAILFVHATTWEGMINAWLPRLAGRLPLFIRKPLYLCPICMTSIWGITLWFNPIVEITYLFAIGGVMVLLTQILPEQ